jgi:hypothetical protein
VKIIDYEESRGFMRRVKLPENEDDPTLGIPIDIYDIIDYKMYDDAPLSFKVRFFRALWQRGMIEVVDLNKRNATDLIMSAYRSAIKFEANHALKIISEFMTDDKSSSRSSNQ